MYLIQRQIYVYIKHISTRRHGLEHPQSILGILCVQSSDSPEVLELFRAAVPTDVEGQGLRCWRMEAPGQGSQPLRVHVPK